MMYSNLGLSFRETLPLIFSLQLCRGPGILYPGHELHVGTLCLRRTQDLLIQVKSFYHPLQKLSMKTNVVLNVVFSFGLEAPGAAGRKVPDAQPPQRGGRAGGSEESSTQVPTGSTPSSERGDSGSQLLSRIWLQLFSSLKLVFKLKLLSFL